MKTFKLLDLICQTFIIVPFLYLLLFLSPLMALFYWWTSMEETIGLYKNPDHEE